MSAPVAVGVHIFAGGFSLGMRSAGLEVACHLESGPYGVREAELNLQVPCFVGREAWPVADLAGEVDVLFGNPPCAVFSNMGVTHDAGPGSQAWRGDPRTSCWWDVLRLAEAIYPSFWCLESVGQAYGTGRPLVDEFTRRALAGGWSVTHLLVDARWHGVSQVRRRFLLCAHRAPRLVVEPVAFVEAPPCGEVLARVPEPGPYSAPPDLVPLARMTLPRGSVSETYDAVYGDSPPRSAAGKRRGRPSFQDRRLDPARLSLVVAGDKLWHPSGERRLGTEEYKALCGFPPWFRLPGPPSGHASLLARGLMPPVAEWVGRTAARTLAAGLGTGAPEVRLVDLTSPPGRSVDLTGEYASGGARSRPDPTLAPPALETRPAGKGRAAARSRPAVSSAGVPERQPGRLEPSEAPPSPGEGSGRYMQRLLLAGVAGDECVARVHRYFEGRTTRRGDAYYNYRKLQASGLYPELPPWRPS